MLAACICGSYKNQMNQPPPFEGHLAKDEEELKHSATPTMPYYVRLYGNIVTGEIKEQQLSTQYLSSISFYTGNKFSKTYILITDKELQPSDASRSDLGAKNMNSKIDFPTVKVDENADFLLAAYQFLDKKEVKGNLGVLLYMVLALNFKY